MSRVTKTIPAAGETLKINIIGKTVYIEDMPVYFTPADVPTFQFELEGNELPLYPDSFYNFGQDFNYITITGTAESAGDEIVIVSLKECRETNIKPAYKSQAGTTSSKAASDAAQSFSQIELQNADGQLPKRIYVWVTGGTTRGINFAYNRAPAQGDAAQEMYWDNDRSHQAAGDSVSKEPLEIIGLDWILKFQFIATVATETPVLIWTGDY